MTDSIGRKRWAIAEGYIPSWSNGPEPEFLSHETAFILNVSDRDARVTITIYWIAASCGHEEDGRTPVIPVKPVPVG